MAEKDQEFVEYVVRAIVEKPEAVQVKRKIDELGVLIELTVDPEDMGKIIGKDGRTAKAVRTLLRVLGAQNNARVNLKIIEPEGGTGGVKADAPADESAPDSAEAEKATPVEESASSEDDSDKAPVVEETPVTDLPETTTSADLDDLKE